jgi:uncharacterized protein
MDAASNTDSDSSATESDSDVAKRVRRKQSQQNNKIQKIQKLQKLHQKAKKVKKVTSTAKAVLSTPPNGVAKNKASKQPKATTTQPERSTTKPSKHSKVSQPEPQPQPEAPTDQHHKDDTATHQLELVYVAGTSDQQRLKELLQYPDTDINGIDRDSKLTPLTQAARVGTLEMVQLLLDLHANIDAPDQHGYTPLLHSFCRKEPDVSLYLLSRNAEIYTIHPDSGRTPLHIAVAMGKDAVIEYFLQHNVMLDLVDNYQQTPLHIGVARNRPMLVRKLSAHGATIEVADYQRQTPLHAAVRQSNYSLVAYIVAQAPNTHFINYADVNGMTALHLAASGNLLKILTKLASAGANVDQRTVTGKLPLHLAASAGVVATLQALIQMHRLKQTAASSNGDSYYDFINAVDHNSWTPLHCAIVSGHRDAIQLLIDSHANIDLLATNTLTDHMWVSTSYSPFSSTILNDFGRLYYGKPAGSALDQGENIDSSLYRPLHFAARKGHSEVVSMLLERSASVNAVTSNNQTALHFAIHDAHPDVIRILLDYGAKTSIVDVCHQ